MNCQIIPRYNFDELPNYPKKSLWWIVKSYLPIKKPNYPQYVYYKTSTIFCSVLQAPIKIGERNSKILTGFDPTKAISPHYIKPIMLKCMKDPIAAILSHC